MLFAIIWNITKHLNQFTVPVYKFLDLINIWQDSRFQFCVILAQGGYPWLNKGGWKQVHMHEDLLAGKLFLRKMKNKNAGGGKGRGRGEGERVRRRRRG